MLIEKVNYKNLGSDIILFEKTVPKDICKQIIDIIEKHPEWKDSFINSQEVNINIRNSKTDYLTTRYGKNADLYYAHNTLGYYIKKVMEELFDLYRLNNHYNSGLVTTISTDEGFQILKYDKGNKYAVHIDDSLMVKNRRIISLIVYLNEEYIGGSTTFTRQNITVKGNTGDILVFPSNYCYPHFAEEIKEGTKYVLVTWFF